jgi:hypothetical protein
MNKKSYKAHMTEYRTRRTLLIKQLDKCSEQEFLVIGKKIKELCIQFNIAKMKSFGVDKYQNFAWVIYRAMNKLGMNGMQAIELTHKFKH